MEKIEDAKQAKKQVEKQRDELEKELRKGQKNLDEGSRAILLKLQSRISARSSLRLSLVSTSAFQLLVVW